MLEDKLLIWKFKRGSNAALERIYEKYELFLITVATALSNNLDVAEDVVHDFFVSFVASADKLKINGNLKAYMAICVANLARDRLRRKQREPAGLGNDLEIASTAAEPVQAAIRREESLKLYRAISQLPYEQKEAIVLHLHGSMKFTQIAELRGASVNTVRSQYRYGISKLRSLLNGEVTR
ncbi:MAG: RNA polymerase sigma factor [Planctomycetota bacterium]|jgi:RNA polymerase sigma-70 factor (ECF subfamily)